MAGSRPLVVHVADLFRHLGTRREIERVVTLDGLAISTAAVPEGGDVRVALELESISNGLVAHGTISAPWVGACRRCLEEVRGEAVAEVREIFERHATEGETYPVGDEDVDLEPMVREAVLLALPLAPLCGPDCRGPAPEEFPAAVEGELPEAEPESPGDGGRPLDPRWAGLDQLKFE